MNAQDKVTDSLTFVDFSRKVHSQVGLIRLRQNHLVNVVQNLVASYSKEIDAQTIFNVIPDRT